MIQDISANAVNNVYAQSGELGSGYTSEMSLCRALSILP